MRWDKNRAGGLCIVGCWGRLGCVARAGVAGVAVVMCSAGRWCDGGWRGVVFFGVRIPVGGVTTVSFWVGIRKTCVADLLTNTTNKTLAIKGVPLSTPV